MVKSADELPEVLVTDILIRLSVKSLVLCKCVCKSWLSIISNPYFIKSHLKCAIIASMNKPTLIKIQYPPPYQDNKPFDASTVAMLSSYPMHYECLAMPKDFISYSVVNSYNGIICLLETFSARQFIYLWNPSIRQYKKLPDHQCDAKNRPSITGFGYDSSSDDYKVFRVVHKKFYDIVPTVQVYSTKADIWRDLEAPILKDKDWTNRVPANVVVKGVMYMDAGDELFSFDMRTDVFGMIPFPGSTGKKVSRVLGFEDYVAMAFASDGSGTGIDVWALDDACVEVSWTKRFIIEAADFGKNIFLDCYLGAGLLYGGRYTDGCIFLYDCDEKKEKKFYVLGELTASPTLKYTESLVSLDGFKQME